MSYTIRATTSLGLMSAALVWALFWGGGTDRAQWEISLLCVAAGGLIQFAWPADRQDVWPPLSGWIKWPMAGLLIYAGLQCVPLPPGIMRELSSQRFELNSAMAALTGELASGPLSVAPQSTLEGLSNLAGCAIAFLLARDLSLRMRCHWPLFAPIIAVGAVEAALGIAQYFGDSSVSGAHGTYVNRNHFSGLLEMGLPLATGGCLSAMRMPSLGGRSVRFCVYFVAAALMLLGVLCSFSRSGLVAGTMGTGLTVAMALSRLISGLTRLTLMAAVIGALIVSAIFLTPRQLIARWGLLKDSPVASDARVVIWKDTIRMMRDYPIFGVGYGGYESAYPTYKSAEASGRTTAAHNDYLQFAAELGLIGTALLSTLTFGILREPVRAIRWSPFYGNQIVAAGCLGCAIAIAIHSLTDFNLYIPANLFVLAWIAGTATTTNLVIEAPARLRSAEENNYPAWAPIRAGGGAPASGLPERGRGDGGYLWDARRH